ncbi:MAG: J domain-containing protein [Treponema sp.]|jgi:DnaJ-domain-containing protein 1|nr:J domain-containing protein [Treponema sp.]
MGIFDRLGDVIKSYLNEDIGPREESRSYRKNFIDPDILEAQAEVEEFLRSGRNERKTYAKTERETPGTRAKEEKSAPEALRADFAELELPFGASSEECKTAYKRLLKIHHPDRHIGNPENIRKATEKSVRINTAFARVEKWRRTGMV